MRKKTIMILFILSTVLGMGDIIGFVVLSILTVASCVSNCNSFDPARIADGSLLDLLLASLGLLFAAVGELLYLIAWIGSLVKQGKQQQWGWFTANLISWFLGVGWIYMVVYLIAVPETSMSTTSAYMPLRQPVQPYSAYPPYPPQQPYSAYPSYPPQQPYSTSSQYSSEPYSAYPPYPPYPPHE